MNVDTLKQQVTAARAAYSNGTVDREALDRAFDIIEQELAQDGKGGKDDGTARQFVRPFGNSEPSPPVKPGSNTSSAPQPSTGTGGNNPVPEQVGKPLQPGGDVEKRKPGQVAGNRP